jgi:threonyl-tRNA synthetase
LSERVPNTYEHLNTSRPGPQGLGRFCFCAPLFDFLYLHSLKALTMNNAIAPVVPAQIESVAPAERYMDVARRMDLLHVGPFAGVMYWQPAGLKMYEKLRGYIRGVHEEAGYLEVKSPSLVGVSAFAKSGHLEKYREAMFLLPGEARDDSAAADGGYAMRPMSCPNHIELYASRRRSYRELPMPLFEFGEVFRNEPSGSLQVLFRMRQFCQDDSHLFVAEDQVAPAVANYLAMAQRVYRELGFEKVDFSVSLRPEQRFGEDALWDRAEEALRDACRAQGLAWDEQEGGGAFYGPKIELGVYDKLGRRWQLGVIQLDYVLPERFDLDYVGADNAKARPVVLHHAVLGSLERMIGILLEVHGVDLPPFLQPYDAVVLAVSEASKGYARECSKALRGRWKDVLVDDSDSPLPAKIAHWKQKGVPRVFVVGAKEVQAHADGKGLPAMLSSGARRLVDLSDSVEVAGIA